MHIKRRSNVIVSKKRCHAYIVNEQCCRAYIVNEQGCRNFIVSERYRRVCIANTQSLCFQFCFVDDVCPLNDFFANQCIKLLRRLTAGFSTHRSELFLHLITL